MPVDQGFVEGTVKGQQRRLADEVDKGMQRRHRVHAVALALLADAVQEDVVAIGHRILTQHHLEAVAQHDLRSRCRPWPHPETDGRNGQEPVIFCIQSTGFHVDDHPAVSVGRKPRLLESPPRPHRRQQGCTHRW